MTRRIDLNIWKDRSAIVTGGASGIGKALCSALSKHGVRVVVTDVDGDGAAKLASALGNGATAQHLDVRDASAFAALVERTAREHGRLDYLFNNAGIGVGGEVQELAVSHWDRVIDVNVRGVVHGVMAAYPLMLRQKSGHIVNTASMGGLVPAPLLTPYATTKHAVVGLSLSLRLEAAPLGVRVSALCPGTIDTPLLDRNNPADLPAISWRPDVRSYLTQLAGPPCSPDVVAKDTLAGMEKNQAVIVTPVQARIGWRLYRTAPGLVSKQFARALAAQRREKARG
jgi:NAD(P)-dependent dehydrogenase (short-subunit alcohol dehydrogenase family)